MENHGLDVLLCGELPILQPSQWAAPSEGVVSLVVRWHLLATGPRFRAEDEVVVDGTKFEQWLKETLH